MLLKTKPFLKTKLLITILKVYLKKLSKVIHIMNQSRVEELKIQIARFRHALQKAGEKQNEAERLICKYGEGTTQRETAYQLYKQAYANTCDVEKHLNELLNELRTYN